MGDDCPAICPPPDWPPSGQWAGGHHVSQSHWLIGHHPQIGNSGGGHSYGYVGGDAGGDSGSNGGDNSIDGDYRCNSFGGNNISYVNINSINVADNSFDKTELSTNR